MQFALNNIVNQDITIDNKLKQIDKLLQGKYNFLNKLVDLNNLSQEEINIIYQQIPISFQKENKNESIKVFKQKSAEYSLYQMTQKEFLSDNNFNYVTIKQDETCCSITTDFE